MELLKNIVKRVSKVFLLPYLYFLPDTFFLSYSDYIQCDIIKYLFWVNCKSSKDIEAWEKKYFKGCLTKTNNFRPKSEALKFLSFFPSILIEFYLWRTVSIYKDMLVGRVHYGRGIWIWILWMAEFHELRSELWCSKDERNYLKEKVKPWWSYLNETEFHQK